MNQNKKLAEALSTANTMALATSVDNIPNVRIVNFVCDESKPNHIYFTSDKTNAKVAEFEKNNQVAITTIPTEQDSSIHVRSQKVSVQKSDKTIKDVQSLFIAKIPSYGEALEHIGDAMNVYELIIKEATITISFDEVISITFEE